MRSKLSFFALWFLVGCSSAAPTPTPPADEKSGEVPAPTLDNIRYPSGKDTVRGVVCHPPGNGPFPAIVLIQDANGLTDDTRDQAKRLARRGYVVLAVELYRGEKAENLMDSHILDRGLPEDRVLDDLKAAVDYLAARNDVKASALGIVGLGMGGGYALDAALRDSRVQAVVNCYGRLITDAKLLTPLHASVFCAIAGKDAGFSADTITQFCRAMDKAGKRIDGIRVFAQCPHGFLDSANWPTYGKPAPGDVEEAWELIGNYLDKELKH
jgi:carboxymethylenebutenolidase